MKSLQLFTFVVLCLVACHSQKPPVETLVAQLGAPDAKRRSEAAAALVAMGPSAVDALMWGISHENPQVRETSVWTLSDIAVTSCEGVREAEPPADVMSALISVLSDADETVQIIGSLGLQQVGEPAVPWLIAALDSGPSSTRLHVAYALGEIGGPHDVIVPALIVALTDAEWNVRRLVVRALVSIGVPAVPLLKAALTGADADRARMAARALSEMGVPEAREALRASQSAGASE